MTASYPASIKSFTTKTTGETFIDDYMNDLQAELVAMETALGISPYTISDTVTATASPASVAEYLDMIANRLKAILGETNWYGTPDFTLASPWTTISGWTALSYVNSWADYGAGWSTGAYCKDQFGFVHLKGLIKNGTVGATIATLPAGYRPAYRQLFGCVSYTTGYVMGRTDVDTSGNIISAAGGNAFHSIHECNFLAEA
jgi:hypothetical protein